MYVCMSELNVCYVCEYVRAVRMRVCVRYVFARETAYACLYVQNHGFSGPFLRGGCRHRGALHACFTPVTRASRRHAACHMYFTLSASPRPCTAMLQRCWCCLEKLSFLRRFTENIHAHIIHTLLQICAREHVRIHTHIHTHNTQTHTYTHTHTSPPATIARRTTFKYS